MIKYPLKVGSVTFDQGAFEGPDGHKGLSDLGSEQKAVVHEFPGGILTAQLYGSVPKPITWSGKLFGANAINRSFELQRLADTPEQVKFTWAQWDFDGFVKDYSATVKSPFEIDYSITFRPLFNWSTISGGNSPVDNDPFTGTVSNAQQTMQQQSTAPASGATLPAGVTSGTVTLNGSITQAVQASGGAVATIPPATLSNLQGQISGLLSQLNPLINGNDPLASSAAADLAGTLNILNVAFANSIDQLITTVHAVNPNLYQLAAKYYGDPSLYWLISDRNDQLDPLPDTAGVALSLAIPILPALANPSYTTVLNGRIS